MNENPIPLRHFYEDRCSIDLQAPDYVTPSGKVYEEYQEYCNERKERPLDANILGIKLKETGIERERSGIGEQGNIITCGIKLRSDLRGQNQALI